MENLENNQLIAKFMGLESFKDALASENAGLINIDKDCYEQARYHSSWDWLMPVVDKIETIEGFAYRVEIVQGVCIIEGLGIEMQGDTKLDATYYGVLEFIEWYNTEHSRSK